MSRQVYDDIEIDPDAAVTAIRNCMQILWPHGEDPLAPWSPDTIEWVASELQSFIPEGYMRDWPLPEEGEEA